MTRVTVRNVLTGTGTDLEACPPMGTGTGLLRLTMRLRVRAVAVKVGLYD